MILIFSPSSAERDALERPGVFPAPGIRRVIEAAVNGAEKE